MVNERADELKFPAQRAELIETLKDLANGDNAALEANYEHGDLTESAYFFLFDDTAIARNPDELVGFVLRDEDEVNQAWRLGSALAQVRLDLPHAAGMQLREHSRWEAIRRYASDFLVVLQCRG